MMNTLTPDNFASAFGTPKEALPKDAQDLIATTDFTYQPLSQEERDQVILEILKKLDSNQFTRVGQHREKIWSEVWEEYLQKFINSTDYSLEVLNPHFMNPSAIVRLNGDYVKTSHRQFELNFFKVFRLWVFQKYLANYSTIYEFGCGSAFNLVSLAKLYPDKQLIGLDWAASSAQLVSAIAKVYGFNMTGGRFDFFCVDHNLRIAPNSAFMTMCALEQIGNRHKDFLEFVLEKRPKLCIQMEPLCELYNENNLVDYLALKYHKQRGYLDGYLTHLRRLESDQRILIQQVKRMSFGSLYSEGYSLVVWQPI
jgi:tRNA G46 methylase TrmB